MRNNNLSIDLCSIMKDVRLSTTQKFIMLAIRCESLEQNTPDAIELPVRTLLEYGIRGHGHIKGHLNKLLEIGYLLEIGIIKREDGYVVTGVRINKDFHQRTHHDLELFSSDSDEPEARLEA